MYHDQRAIINESGDNYSFLQYQITIGNQVTQLKECGFTNPVQAFDRQGKLLDNDFGNSENAWIYYCKRK